MDLTAGQRVAIRRLLEEELRTALRAALGRGSTAEVDELVAGRRRALGRPAAPD